MQTVTSVDQGFCFPIDHRHGYTARDSHIGSAGAGNRLCSNYMLTGEIFRGKLDIHPLGDHVQGTGGQSHAARLQRLLQLGLHLVGKIALRYEGDKCGQVYNAVRQLVKDLIAHIGKRRFEVLSDDLLHLCLVADRLMIDPRDDLGKAFVHPFPGLCLQSRLQVFKRFFEHARQAVLKCQAVKILTGKSVLDRLQRNIDQLFHALRQDRPAKVRGRILKSFRDGLRKERLHVDLLARRKTVKYGRAQHGVRNAFHLGEQLPRNILYHLVELRDAVGPFRSKLVRLHVQQAFKARPLKKGRSQLIDRIGNQIREVRAQLVAVCKQAHLIEQVGDFLVKQLFELFDQRQIAAVLFLLFRLCLRRMLHDGAHIQRIGCDRRAADRGVIVNVDDIDRHCNAHADRSARGGCVCLRLSHGAVEGNHMHCSVHIPLIRLLTVFGHQLRGAHRMDVHTVSNGCICFVVLNIEYKTCCHRHAAFTGLCALPVAVCPQHAAGRYVAAAVHAGQSCRAARHAISLSVGFAFLTGSALSTFRAGVRNAPLRTL